MNNTAQSLRDSQKLLCIHEIDVLMMVSIIPCNSYASPTCFLLSSYWKYVYDPTFSESTVTNIVLCTVEIVELGCHNKHVGEMTSEAVNKEYM